MHFAVAPKRHCGRCHYQGRKYKWQKSFPLPRPLLPWTTAQCLRLVLSRIIASEHPQMAFRIPTPVTLSAAIFHLYCKNDLSVFALQFLMVCLDVGHDEIARLRLNTTDLLWMDDVLFEWRVLNRRHHDHTVTERQLGMFDFPVLPSD